MALRDFNQGPTVLMTNEDRRRQLLDAATRAFAERGVEATTMDAVAEGVGTSKGTIYAYFPTKAKLVLAIVHACAAQLAEFGQGRLDPARDYRAVLLDFGRQYLDLLSSPLITAGVRAALHTDTHFLLERGATPLRERLRDFMQILVDRKLLYQANAQIMADHLLGLLEGGALTRLLAGAASTAHAASEHTASAAVHAFCRAYHPIAASARSIAAPAGRPPALF